MPLRTRSEIRSRSKFANTDRMPANARPLGVLMSIASERLTKTTPSSLSFSSVVTGSFSDRPPAIELLDQDGVDLAAPYGLQERLALRPGLRAHISGRFQEV
jgi:hypothetical protein